MFKKLVYLGSLLLILAVSRIGYTSPQTIVPGVTWYDTSDNIISAHGAGVIKVGDTYYLIGMYTDNDPNNWMEVSGGHGCPLFVAITCYSSTDFANWTFENNLLTQQPSGDLGHYRWVGRPKVIYNDPTEEYVMYMSIDDPCALLTQREGKVGVATCSTVNGNYTYHGSFNPLGDKVYDITLFKDDDGKGYLITTGINIYELTSDYLGVSSLTTKVRDREAEAPAMYKTGGVYYLLCSKSTWWTSNDNYYWYSTSLSARRWTEVTDFTPDSPDTCNSQTTYVQPIEGSSTTTFVYLGDRWDEWNFGNSTYVWLPLTLDGTTLTTYCYDEWTIDTETGEWGLPPTPTPTATPTPTPTATPTPTPQPDMYVNDIAMSWYEAKTGYVATATIWIKDEYTNDVNAATVTGEWSGATTSGDEQGETGQDGKVTLESKSVKGGGTFTFTVTDVSATGYTYDPSLNVMDSNSISAP